VVMFPSADESDPGAELQNTLMPDASRCQPASHLLTRSRAPAPEKRSPGGSVNPGVVGPWLWRVCCFCEPVEVGG
jgi:hypothetical protein